MKYERLFLEEIDDVLALVAHAEDYRTEYNTVRPPETIAGNRPLEVHLSLTDPTTTHFPETHSLPAADAAHGFADTVQVAELRRTTTVTGKKSVEVVYVIASADACAADPATLATWVRGHWTVEDRLHRVRDVTFDEDRSQTAAGATPQVTGLQNGQCRSPGGADHHV